MTTFYVDTGGATTNSGSTDQNSPNLSGAAATVAASTVTLDGSPDLSALVTSGANQSTIYLNDATNSNRKIFKIAAFDNTAKTVTVDAAPTGITSSSWAIGGRIVWTPANIEAALAAGDTVIINNNPAARTSTFITSRTSGDTTSGKITLKGKTGVRPVINITNTSNVISGGGQVNWRIENLELDQDGATGFGITTTGTGWDVVNVKISDAGQSGIFINAGGGWKVTGCEISGCGEGISLGNGNNGVIRGNHIHDNAGNGITIVGTAVVAAIVRNIIDSNGGRGIYLSGAPTSQAHVAFVNQNTIYGNGDSGLEAADADCSVDFCNNIFQDNATNVKWAAGTCEFTSYHRNNFFYQSGGGTNLSGVTADATDSTSNPGLTNPASGDFTLRTNAAARASGFPGQFLGGGLSYLDAGALQAQSVQRGYIIGG